MPTKNKFQVLSILQYAPDGKEETEAPNNVEEDTNCGEWVKEETVLDSGSVECVRSRKRVPHLKVEELPKSRRGETLTCAG